MHAFLRLGASFGLMPAFVLGAVALSSCSADDAGRARGVDGVNGVDTDVDGVDGADASAGSTGGGTGTTAGSSGGQTGSTTGATGTTGAGGDTDGGASDGEDSGGSTGFPPISDSTKNGPFPTNNPRGEAGGPNCSIHRPATLGENGLRHPVIIWGMGTGGFNTYQAAFDLWASNGFIVAAALQGDGQGSGVEMLGCLDYVCTEYAPNIDCSRVGASGHSQGGGGALMVGQDPRLLATAPVQPYIGQGFGGFDQASLTKQVGPMLLLSGTADTIAAPAQHQQPVFETTNVPVFWANLVRGDHVAEGFNGIAGYRVMVLEWFALHLMGDKAFRARFYGPSCTYCSDTKWMVQREGIN